MSSQKIFKIITSIEMLAASLMLLGMSGFALAGTTARDHLGPNGAPQRYD
jgi:hypothetical protein